MRLKLQLYSEFGMQNTSDTIKTKHLNIDDNSETGK